MESSELECPWPAGGIDLCLIEPSSSEMLIVLKLQTTQELANLYNLKIDSLNQYARHVINRGITLTWRSPEVE